MGISRPWPQNGCILVVHRDFTLARNKAFDYAEQRLSEGITVAKPVGADLRSGPAFSHSALIQAGTHPDCRYLEPAEGSQWITIDAIRDLIGWASHKPMLAHHRVAIFSAAEALNPQAANALLKTLEESSLQTTFLLLTHQPALVLTTLRSRCYRENLHSVEGGQADLLEQLSLMQADLQALVQGEIDPITLAKQWCKGHSLQENLDIFWHVLRSLLAWQQSWGLIDKVLEAKKSLTEGAMVNDFLVLSALWIEYAAIMKKQPALFHNR